MTDDGKRLDGNGLARVWQAVQAYVAAHKGNNVGFTRSLSSGTKIGTIDIDNVATDLYAPSGTVTSITAGTGLSGGTITSTGTINLSAATSNTLGGVKVTYDSETQSLYISTQ